ncbi:hypothetical protein BDY19DRAFT_996840 [Irpex rosettiformis]|uniref:Uncharacterized protein n=1 Tax=Irpex rosettiformis TaxID=378272 RepID=A0ACB8TTU6_9APHY|nr:hypothetical protein BDY19DRAFT_996840 [Irpex rosettiformis]
MTIDPDSLPLRAAQTTQEICNDDFKDPKAAMQDTKFSVPVVPLSYFKENLLPPLHDQLDIASVIDNLWKSGIVRANNIQVDSKELQKGRWRLFPDDPSSSKDFKEDRVFRPFARLAESVAKQAKALSHEIGMDFEPKQTVKFVCNPNMAPDFIDRYKSSKPDSYGVLIERSVDTDDEKAPHWDDVVVPGEFKMRKRDADFNDNNAKMIWSLHHAMRETVYRRFVFGYTIEDTDMRLWFCSRSELIVSETFNFIMDHEALVYFFLSIMFSPITKLGYDPTILPAERTRDQRTTKYSIKVTGQGREATYVTHQVLANISAEVMQGKATRVWRGKGVDEKGRPTGHNMVIKDCWIDTDRKREGDILAEILEAAKTSTNPNHLQNIKDHFLTVVHHGDVLVDGVKDTTLSLRRGTEFPEPRRFLDLVRSSAAKEVDKPPAGLVTLGEDAAVWLRGFRSDDKSHYRIVFDSEENCDPIDTLTSGRAIWNAFIGAFIGVCTLHELGFIHRDISAGNVLVGRGIPGVVQAGIGKIVDLEFCKRIDDNSPVHQRRVGTRYFIPLEVEKQVYFFGPDTDDDDVSEISLEEVSDFVLEKPTSVEPLGNTRKTSADLSSSQSSDGSSTSPFVNNPLHDLESLWWLSVYLILPRSIVEKEPAVRVKIENGESEGGKDKEDGPTSTAGSSSVYATQAIPQWVVELLVDYGERQISFSCSDRFLTQARLLHKSLAVMVKELNNARRSLVKGYTTAERNLYTTGLDLTVVKLVHRQHAAAYLKIRQSFDVSGDLEFNPMPFSFVQPLSIPPEEVRGSSLDSALVLAGMKTRKHALDETNRKEEQGSVGGITTRMQTLSSPTRASITTSRSSKRARRGDED